MQTDTSVATDEGNPNQTSVTVMNSKSERQGSLGNSTKPSGSVTPPESSANLAADNIGKYWSPEKSLN